MDRGKAAYDYFLNGYNCIQSVLMAYKDFFPEESFPLILKSASPLGGGVSRLREICGAVSGAAMVLGSVFGYSRPEENEKKGELYSRVQEVASRFETENDSYVCHTLLGLEGKSDPIPEERSAHYYTSRPCPGFCMSSASILENYLREEGILDEEGERIR